MDFISWLIWVLALAVGVYAYSRPGQLHIKGLKIAGRQTIGLTPKIMVAMLVSGFFSAIVPTEHVAAWIGKESGVRGVLVGSLVGGFTPGGPIICFPVVVILYKTGAGIAPLIAFLTAWSVFAVHRILTYEVPLIGIRFVLLRMLSSFILPPVAGFLTMWIEANLVTGL
jgi:uncharacterized membrane protein YraQ (UPF0718 family)